MFSAVASVHDKSRRSQEMQVFVRLACHSQMTDVFFCPYGLCRPLRHLLHRDELHAVMFQAWRSMITQVITRPCGLYTSLRHPIWIVCGSLSGCARQELDIGRKSFDFLFVE